MVEPGLFPASHEDRHGCFECPVRAAIDRPGGFPADPVHRLKLFDDLGLLEIRHNPSLDRIVRLASRAIGAPISLVSLVTDDRQVFVAQLGLCSPWREQAETPLSHSFCQHVMANNRVLRVNDARLDPCLRHNLAIRDLGVVAYLGAPLQLDCGVTLGALCVIEPTPREWTDEDVALLTDHTALVVQEIELRRMARLERQKSEALLEKSAQFELALGHMAHGLSFYDRDKRLITANPEFSVIYKLDHDKLQRGMSIEDIADMRGAAGTLATVPLSDFVDWIGSTRLDRPDCREFELLDGRIIRIFCCTTVDGGWVLTDEDITDRMHLRREIEDRERLYRLLAENTNDVVILAEPNGSRLYFSPAVNRLLGYTQDEARAIAMRDWIHPDDISTVFLTTSSLTLDAPVSSVGFRLRHKQGHYLWAEAAFRLFKAETGHLQIVATVRDISKRKEVEAEYRDLFANANVGLFRMSPDGRLLRANEALAHLCGYANKDALLAAAADSRADSAADAPRLLDGGEIVEQLRNGGEVSKLVQMIRRKDTDEPAYLMLSAWPVPPNQPAPRAIEGSVLDITDRILHEQSIRHLALHDPLTGLPNRVYFQSEANRRAKDGEAGLTIAYLDLDLFKNVNDQFGHAAGDECLTEIGRRLQALGNASNTMIARLGGDEFAILLARGSRPEMEAFASSIIETIRQPIALSRGDDVRLGVSVGLAELDGVECTDPSEVLRRADLAMYAAKTAGRNAFAWFDPGLDQIRKTRTQLDRDLKLALDRDEFFLVFQPQFSLDDGQLEGFEALLRWHHPTRGLVPPSDFIPIAESNGLIRPIGRWVIQRACEFASRLAGRTRVSVNVSALQFCDARFVPFVLETADAHGLARGTLEIELTEGILLESTPEFQAMIERLRDSGVTISIDDFGTGYSSLGYLSKFPFDSIKVDRSFISDMNSEIAHRILRSIIAMGNGMNKTIVIEGVETIEQVTFLKQFSNLVVQGYFFGKPMRHDTALEIELKLCCTKISKTRRLRSFR